MSTDAPRPKQRRDADPVRVYKDGRVIYYPSGRPGVGERTFERHGTLDAAEDRAAVLRQELARGVALGRRPRILGDLMQALLEDLRETGAPQGTIRQYRSDWNTWVAPRIGGTLACAAGIADWSRVFDAMAREGTPAAITNVARTLNAVVKFGVLHDEFGDQEPFGATAVRRKDAVARALKAAERASRAGQRRQTRQITVRMTPTRDDVEDFAQALEALYPGYGARLVYFGYGSGLRINECLAQRDDTVDPDTGLVVVNWQLDRYRPFDALVPPKGGHTRESFLWSCYADVARSLIEDARDPHRRDRTWLFPRMSDRPGWADEVAKLLTQARKDCSWPWTFHWLRHGYASWSLAPVASGGFGQDPASVQHWLGHQQLSTTLDTYVQPKADAAAAARSATRTPPGLPRPDAT